MTQIIVDTSVLDRIIRESGANANDILQKLAQDTEADIKMNFSTQSPSAPGEPPGVDTGNLKNSITAEPDGNDWIVYEGTDGYGAMLEYGTERMAARPYFGPAIERTVERAPNELLKIVEDK